MKKFISIIALALIIFVSACQEQKKIADIEINLDEEGKTNEIAEVPEAPAQPEESEQPALPAENKTAEAKNETNMPPCDDDDIGLSYYLKGNTSGTDSITKNPVNATDFCGTNETANIVTEYACQNGYVIVREYKCDNGCYEGACLSSPSSAPKITMITETTAAGPYKLLADRIITPKSACLVEGDRGYNPLVQGTLTIESNVQIANSIYESDYKGGPGPRYKTVPEFCGEPGQTAGKYLNETYCDKYGRPHQADLECDYGCENGACKIS